MRWLAALLIAVFIEDQYLGQSVHRTFTGIVEHFVQYSGCTQYNRHSAYLYIVLIFLDLFFNNFVKEIVKWLKNSYLSF